MPLLGAAAWAGALAATAWGGLGPALVGLGALVPAIVLVAARRAGRSDGLRRWAATVAALAVVALAVASLTWVRGLAVTEGPLAELAHERARVELVATVVSDPRQVDGGFEPRTAVRLQVTEVTARGVVVRLRSAVLVLGDDAWRGVELGERVRAGGRLAPGDRGVSALLTGATEPERLARPDLWWRGAAVVRQGIREAVAGRPADQRALVPALVDGDDAALDPGLEADFRTTGLTHLTAVSGTNLTLVVGFLLVLARWCRVRGRWLLLVGALGICGFVLLARTEPSVVRAATMGAVGLLALGSNGRHRALRALGLAVVVLLLVQPALATTAGFALSVLATAGIVLLGPGLRDALARWMPRWCAEAVAVPAAAQVACTPLVAAISGEVSLVAVVANLLVAPVVGPATVLGLVGGLVVLVLPPVGLVLGWGAGACVGWIAAVARRGADLPAASLGWGTGPASLLLLVVLCVLLVLVAPRVLARPRSTLLCCAVLGVAVCVRLPTPGWPPPGWVLVACDVGQGDALVLRSGPGSAVVVDAGPDPPAVEGCLDRLGVTEVPLVVLTHFHADHVDGLPGVLAGRRVGLVETSRTLDPSAGSQQVREQSAAAAVPASAAPYGTTRTVGEVRLQAVWPRPGPVVAGPGDGSAANDASVVLLAEVGGVRILLTGDIEPPSQALLARALPGLHVDVLKVPHHGSRYQDLDWLESLEAPLAVVSAGADNDYGHPAPDLLDALEDAGTEVGRTDEQGDVAVVVEAGEARLVTRD
ncbi:ComEC/Rec2 family competence protein [Nocardioides nanhaiensis]|uniref:ComEC/Rec2 family competence protein n=1 Tax=Nocardioides nanhaiensis TaxID=1476871 RepID=A0ABP8WS30_9ACTN